MEESLIDRALGVRIPKEKYPRFSGVFWASFVTGLTGILSLATSHGLHELYYIRIETNKTLDDNSNETSCIEHQFGLWAKCLRQCNETLYQCSDLSPQYSEAFITVSRVFESVALAFAVFGMALALTSRRFRRMGELKTSIMAFIASGLLCIIGAYLFVVKFKDHTPEESTSQDLTPVSVDQEPGWSFYLCVVNFFMAMLTAMLNGTEWCRVVNYGLD